MRNHKTSLCEQRTDTYLRHIQCLRAHLPSRASASSVSMDLRHVRSSTDARLRYYSESYGSNANRTSCGGTRGCCGSCFQSGFDEDDFEKAERKAEERRRKERGRDARNTQQQDQESSGDGIKERDGGITESVREAGEKEEKTPPRVPDIVIHQPTPVHSMSSPPSQ